MPKLTKRFIDCLKPDPEGRDLAYWDSALAGFGVRVKPSGAMAYLVPYRTREGRSHRVTVGRVGRLTPEEARREARRVLGEVDKGHDPAEAKRSARRDMTIDQLCDLYLAEGAHHKKASTLAMDRSRLAAHVRPLLGKRLVRAITRGDIERFLRDVTAGKTRRDAKIEGRPRARSIVKGGRGAAARTLGMLGAIFAFAEARGMRADNPVRGVKRSADGKRQRFLSTKELADLGAALAARESAGDNRGALAAIRLLILTGCRKAEILGLRWSEVDLERGFLRLADSKTGPKEVPLGAPVRALLDALPRLPNCPYVLPGRSGKPVVGLQRVWQRVRDDAGLTDVRLHDLRHSFASIGAAGGDSLYIIGALLGHRDSKTTQRYAHLSPDPKRAAVDRISETIAAALSGSSAEVLPLPGRAARG